MRYVLAWDFDWHLTLQGETESCGALCLSQPFLEWATTLEMFINSQKIECLTQIF